MKLVVLFIFIVLPWISRVGDWALGWTEGNERLQIVFVMMLFPVIMNAVQYYIIDSFIKKQSSAQQQQQQDQPQDGESVPADVDDANLGGAGRTARRSSFDATAGLLSPAGSHDGIGSDDEDNVKMKRPRVRELQRRHSEYNPDVDGETSTLVLGSSSSTSGERSKILPTELFPRE